MRAMQLARPQPIEQEPLAAVELPVPEPGQGELLVRVSVCGVCHTDLHIAEGDIPLPKLPIVPGHQAVGRVEKCGPDAKGFAVGERVGVAWLHRACGRCPFCGAGAENLCENGQFTGLHVDGGFAEFMTAPADFVSRIPESYSDAEAAPLLCAGIVGYRALRRSRIASGGRLGLYGFGASAHIALQVARHWGCDVYVFTRTSRHQELARELGAAWVGRAEETPPAGLHSAIIFAPAGTLAKDALRALEPGGTLALAGITMSTIPELDYGLLYRERTITSVANATRADGRELLDLAARVRLRTHVEEFPLAEANQVLRKIKESRIEASAVLRTGVERQS